MGPPGQPLRFAVGMDIFGDFRRVGLAGDSSRGKISRIFDMVGEAVLQSMTQAFRAEYLRRAHERQLEVTRIEPLVALAEDFEQHSAPFESGTKPSRR